MEIQVLINYIEVLNRVLDSGNMELSGKLKVGDSIMGAIALVDLLVSKELSANVTVVAPPADAEEELEDEEL